MKPSLGVSGVPDGGNELDDRESREDPGIQLGGTPVPTSRPKRVLGHLPLLKQPPHSHRR